MSYAIVPPVVIIPGIRDIELAHNSDRLPLGVSTSRLKVVGHQDITVQFDE
jgi:hypothetical protein